LKQPLFLNEAILVEIVRL